MVIAPSAILKDTKHPNGARLLMEFFDGPEFSGLLAKNFESPLRDDVTPPAGRKSLAEMQLFAPTEAQIDKELPANKAKWRDTFGM
jgi:iron(III) transport system substrate-binding protein